MRGVGAGARIFELIDRTPVVNPDVGTDLDPTRRGRVMFENIGFEYPSRKGVEILKEFNLDLNVGESVAIVLVFWCVVPASPLTTFGQWEEWKREVFSGVPAVTILRPRAGEGYFRRPRCVYDWEIFHAANTPSLDIREFTTKSWRDVIGLVPQDPIMFTGTIASNIAYGNQTASRDDIETAALEANCDFVWGMPQSFDTPGKMFHEVG